MKNLTRMLAIASLSLAPMFAAAADMKDEGGMMKDDTMEPGMSDHGMEKDDMADDMGHGMKDESMDAKGMDEMKKDTMKKADMSMDDDTMDDKDSMQ
ncbi:hypothetical protein BKP64_14195 [Marinobacter salinus]|uniref:Pentapeptide MXKDX repeat protein n=1 Tax=Marinobacter salinus TaxID=1874317 RepID=A0A1D9GNY3_9GAMM|nr:hypothetical protein [Marinobacter salinus]AOY89225.1 hypothetical protein BKP64_14195 [Marinobacter salinus]